MRDWVRRSASSVVIPTLHRARDTSRIQSATRITARRPASVDPDDFLRLFQTDLSDSAAAAAPVPGCTAGPGPDDAVAIRLVVVDSVAREDGRIEIDGSAATDARTTVQVNEPGTADALVTCSFGRGGTLRAFGAGAFDRRPLVVRAVGATTVAVVTGSGRILVEPTAIGSDTRVYVLAWRGARH